MSKTMNRSDILFGHDHKMTPRKTLQVWAQMERDATGWAGGTGLSKINDAKRATTVAAKEMKEGSLGEAYCKIGWVGKDLMFRIKSKASAKSSKAYTEQDFVLAKNCRPDKKAAAKSASDKTSIRMGKFYVLTSGYLSQPLSGLLDIGNGFTIEIETTIEGPARSKGFEARLRRDFEKIQDAYRAKAESAIDALNKAIKEHRGGTIEDLKLLVAKTEKQIAANVSQSAVEKVVKAAVDQRLATEKQDDKKRREWRVRNAVKVTTGGAKIVLSGARLYFSSGTDVKAYTTIMFSVMTIKNVVEDIIKTEPKLRQDVEKAIEDHIAASEDLLGAVAGVYTDVKKAGDTKLLGLNLGRLGAAINSAGRMTDAVTGKIVARIRKLIGLKLSSAVPEKKRNRYHVYLSKQRRKIDVAFKDFMRVEGWLKGSQLREAVKIWKEYATFKADCQTLLDELEENEEFAEAIRDRLMVLGIEVSDATTFDKIKATYRDVKQLELKKAISSDGTGAAVALVPTARSILSIVRQVAA